MVLALNNPRELLGHSTKQPIPGSSRTSTISVAVLWSNSSKKLSIADMRSSHELFSLQIFNTWSYNDKLYKRTKRRTYIRQLCEDTGCSPENLPEAMNGREKWRERVRDIRISSTWWWWWWWYLEKTNKIKQDWKKSQNVNLLLLLKVSRSLNTAIFRQQ